MKTRIFLLAALLMLLCAEAFAEADITGSWGYIGDMDHGEFIPSAADNTYTFKGGGSLDCAGKVFSVTGFWGDGNGITLVYVDGTDRAATLLDNGTLLVGNHITGMVFSRDGTLPAFIKVEDGVTEEGFYYKQLADGTLAITGHVSNDERVGRDDNGVPTKGYDLVIPAAINGLPVSMIDSGAFSGNALLRTIVLPEGMRYIARDAFSDCHYLTSVTIPETVNAIGRYAFSSCDRLTDAALPASLQELDGNPFADCTALTAIVLPKENRWFTLVEGALICRADQALYSFPCGSGATIYTVPDCVTTIELAAFMGCRNLQQVILHEDVTRVRSYAFERSGLTHITLPAALTNLGSNPFVSCHDLIRVDVAPDNARYESVDGVLFDKRTSALIYYPMGKPETSYTVPQGTKIIDWDAFIRNRYLTSIVIPDSVERIEGYAFYAMAQLTSITIPESVTYLGAYAFGECPVLESIELPASITRVEGYAFMYSGLKQITIAEGTEIDETAFEECGEVTVTYK